MTQPLTEKQQYWNQHLEQADNFNGSLADYARLQGLSAQHLYQWRSSLRKREMRQEVSQTVFTEVSRSTVSQASLTVHLGAAQMVFAVLPDAHWLASLLSDHE